jgi:predicted ATPase
MNGEVSTLVEILKRIKQGNVFKKYIDYIQFPFFRNLELDQRINFTFPLTVFVGPNGSGKSSTLHALYGCPEGKTPYDFWFSTEVDPVLYELESRGLRHSFFYGYKNENGEELQVVKARIKRKNNPNYWETSRPLLRYGMNPAPEGKERNEPIKKNVIYLDFRSELSAFDKYFYFEIPPENLVSKTKQDYLRYKSKYLKSLFDGAATVINSPHGYKQNKTLINLTAEELSAISDILGKNYIDGKVLEHKLFHTWGLSILLKTKFHEYSEAFAGSGEMSIVRLVQNILNASEGSLILLDEPEVSLHPGAQKRLKLFLLNQIKEKKHQVVISTHSPTLIEGLPKESIKVFFQKEDTGKFIIKENILPEEAFYFIGQQIGDKLTIVVEDKLAQKVIKRILENLGPEVNNRFEIRPIPGGAEAINKFYIPVYSNTNNSKYYFLLDGDKKHVENLYDILTLQEQDKNELFLKAKIKEETGCNIPFYVDGNLEGGNVPQRIKMMIDFLKYFKEHVKYFPMNIPEDIIWSDQIIQQKLNQQDYEQNITRINSLGNSKQKIFETSKILFGVDTQIGAFEDMLINEWIKREDENHVIIKNIIESL